MPVASARCHFCMELACVTALLSMCWSILNTWSEQGLRTSALSLLTRSPICLSTVSTQILQRLEQALVAMHEVAGKAKIKFGEFPSEMRPEFITPDLAHLIDRYSDAAYLAIGAQSGSEAMLEAMHREHDVAAVERAVTYLTTHCRKLKKIYVDFIAGLPGETPEDEALSQQLMERLTRVSPKVCIHSHTFMPLPGTPMQFMPPGSVGRTTRATFEKLSQRGQEWGDWQEQEEIAHSISEFRRELRDETAHREEKWRLMEKQTAITTAIQSTFGQQVEFLQRLVRARSSNPFLPESSPPDVPVEEEVAVVIQQELHQLGFQAELIGVSSRRPNVLCHIPGSGQDEENTDPDDPHGYGGA